MINLFVFVEGDDDIRFLKDILYIEFLNHSINIIPVPYQQSRNHIVKKHIKAANASKNSDYVLISDLDSHTYPCITERKRSRFDELEGLIELDKIIIAREEIESWFLAGVNTDLDVFSKFTIPDNTENISKEDFDEMIQDASFDKFEMFLLLAKYYDFDLALKRNSSLKYFVDRYC